jgi:hypothetical protein
MGTAGGSIVIRWAIALVALLVALLALDLGYQLGMNYILAPR